jgi:hypothetical protein
MRIYLNAHRGFYERYQHTYLQPIKPPQAHFPSGPSKMNPRRITSPANTAISNICSENPSPSCSGNNSPSPFTQYNNTILLTVSHKKHFASYDIFRRKYTGVCRLVWPAFKRSVSVKYAFK